MGVYNVTRGSNVNYTEACFDHSRVYTRGRQVRLLVYTAYTISAIVHQKTFKNNAS
jgi:hypothetical protein